MKIVECVPNFSEGKDRGKIAEITAVIESVNGVTLLDVDPGADTNRTVVTFIGTPESVAEAAFRAIKRASEVIDMRTHTGAHPRMGATDVCPFVPVEGVTMEECAKIAHLVGKRVGEELAIPVYCYEYAATSEQRRDLSVIRKGEYEGLPDKLSDPQWRPDYGPSQFNTKSGATVIGARQFLIAYNITLNTREVKYATDIAFELRAKGRVMRSGDISPFYFRGDTVFYKPGFYPCGNCETVASSPAQLAAHYTEAHRIDFVRLCQSHDYDFEKLSGCKALRSGLFEHCKSIGWYVDQYERAQISINLTDYTVTPPHIVLEKARQLATQRGLVVTGSEIVGMIPFRPLYDAGRFYLANQVKSRGVPVLDVLKGAVQSMGLSDCAPFDIDKKVIGLPKPAEKALVKKTVVDFLDEVSRDTPAPGGGSVAALCGALGASLSSMVANLSQENKTTRSEMMASAEKCQMIKDDLVRAVDDDTQAFNVYLTALRMPKNTLEEKALRTQKMQEGLKSAIAVPYKTALDSFEAMKACKYTALHGNQNSITDAAVGCQVAFAGVRGGVWNAMINLKDLKDEQYRNQMQNQ
ncbi:MAG: glutamate formimidoyltransferase, partial [Chitinivibrionales bacterium]|nr:glutamate formimidoyltransferase [Chitinivibrionales bacterium]